MQRHGNSAVVQAAQPASAAADSVFSRPRGPKTIDRPPRAADRQAASPWLDVEGMDGMPLLPALRQPSCKQPRLEADLVQLLASAPDASPVDEPARVDFLDRCSMAMLTTIAERAWLHPSARQEADTAAKAMAERWLAHPSNRPSTAERTLRRPCEHVRALAYAGRTGEARACLETLLQQTSSEYNGLPDWRLIGLDQPQHQEALDRRSVCRTAFEVALISCDPALLVASGQHLDASFLGTRAPPHLTSARWALAFVLTGQSDMCEALTMIYPSSTLRNETAQHFLRWRTGEAVVALAADPALATRLRDAQSRAWLALGFQS